MIHAGDSIVNPVTGERLVFRQTTRETGGEAVGGETHPPPKPLLHRPLPPPPRRPAPPAPAPAAQEERFQVLRGSVGFKVGRRKLVAGPGQRVTVPAGTAHKFWNAGEDAAHFVCE